MHTLGINSASALNPIIDGLNDFLSRLPGTLFVLVIGAILIQIVVRLTRLVMRLTGAQRSFRQVLGSVVEIILWIALTIIVLQSLGFSGIITFFTGSVLALGLVMAAGGSTLVSDIVAGLFLARDADFNVGDEVVAGETPTQGVIVAMDARRVRIRDDKGILHVLPNSLVERKEWVVTKPTTAVGLKEAAAKTARQLSETALKKAAAIRRSAAGSATNNNSTEEASK